MKQVNFLSYFWIKVKVSGNDLFLLYKKGEIEMDDLIPSKQISDYLKEKNQIVYYGFIDIDDMKPGDLIFTEIIMRQ